MRRPALLALLVLLAGCDDWSRWFDEPEPRQPIPRPRVEGVVYSAVTTTARAPAPPRSEPNAAAPDLAAGDGWVFAGACHGDDEARERLLALLPGSPVWGFVMEGCDDPGYCTWLTESARAAPSIAPSLLRAGLGCADALAAYTDAATPDALVVEWFARRAMDDRPIDHPRLREAARQVLTTGDLEGLYPAIEALTATREGEIELLAIHAALPDPWLRNEIALRLELPVTPQGRSLHQAACHVSRREGVPCEVSAFAIRDPLTDLDEVVREGMLGGRRLLAAFPGHRSAILSTLERCAADARLGAIPDQQGAYCLRTLAHADRARARQIAGADIPAAWPWSMQPLVRALTRFEDEGGLVADLRQRGLIDGASRPGDALTAADVLAAHGKAVSLMQAGPVADELLARRLLAAAGVLDVPVRVLPPGERGGGWRTLLAWVDGRRHRALAHDYGHLADGEQVVGFVNTVLEARGVPERFAYLYGNPAVAALGAPSALAALADEGLIQAWIQEPNRGLAGSEEDFLYFDF